jgi:Flp pilus assembly protein TadG
MRLRGFGLSRIRLSTALARFRREEDGALVYFAILLFMLMIMMGGIAVDAMRYEQRRTNLQSTLDRSTLAAASMTQDLDPESVVRDYFEKAGLTPYLTKVTVTEGLNFRNVKAQAKADAEPMFLGLLGIDDFQAKAVSAAEQRINNVEIMLILDVSGSMGQNNRITNLKTAAREFVSTLLANDAEKKISIGIVPFNGQVNLGTQLASYFSTSDFSGNAGVRCVDLPNSVYNTYAISTATSLSYTADADTYSSSTTPGESNKWCPGGTTYTGNPQGTGANIVRLPQQNVTTLQGYISGLTAIGATSINAGMKWGMTLLDPSMQNIYSAERAAARIPSTMVGRPFAYDAEDTMKVIVLMTDGENFAEERVNNAYYDATLNKTINFKSGNSIIWKQSSGTQYSVFHESRVVRTSATTICNSRPFWVSHLSAWQSRPWNGTSPNTSACYDPNATYTGATNLTWPEVWSAFTVQYVASTFYRTPLGGSTSTYTNMIRTQTTITDMNTQLQSACTAAKAAGVLIYGIAFEAPTNGQTQIAACATSPSHYFNATGLQIQTAFRAIANNISQLRLLQ